MHYATTVVASTRRAHLLVGALTAALACGTAASASAGRDGRKRAGAKKRHKHNGARDRTPDAKDDKKPKGVLQTNAVVVLRARPGEAAEPVGTLDPGTRVAVVNRRGRWLQVTVDDTKGWLTRTTVEPVGGRRAAPRRRPTRPRAWRLGAGARGESMDAPRAAATSAEPAVETQRPVERRPIAPPSRLALRARAEVGFRAVAMTFTSDVRAGLGNYVVSTQVADAGVGGELRYAVVSRLLVAADAAYRFGYSSPGIHYESSAGPIGDIAFSTHDVTAGAGIGARLGKRRRPIDVLARAGYRYEVFLVETLDNVGRLPNERLAGATAGLRVAVPRATRSLALEAGADVLLAGERAQTPGLEDGSESDVSAGSGHVAARYRASAALEITAGYRYDRVATRWSGPSARVPGVDGARRVDASHTLLVGLGLAY